jgi:hypothetical protein
MRLAIADPPYPPYRDGRSRATRWYDSTTPTNSRHVYTADHHESAADWDDAVTHKALLERLHAEYDGWAIATSSDGADIYGPLPGHARRMVWVNPRSLPGGGRIISAHEIVILSCPRSRLGRQTGTHVRDVLIQPSYADGFTGAKPPQWTLWVLDALGYEPESDTVADLFPGSGAVTAAIQHYQPQLVVGGAS